MNLSGHDPYLAPVGGRDDSRTVGPYEPGALSPDVTSHPYHVPGRHPLRDTDDQWNTGIGGLQHRVGGARRRHVDDGDVGLSLLDRLLDGIEDGDLVQEHGAATARGDAGHHVGAVLNHLGGVKRPLPAGNALDHHTAVAIDENAHWLPNLFSTSIPSERSEMGWTLSPDS